MIILLVIIGLALLILGHEAGHFVVAKLSGMKVDEFGFGFPPRLFKKKIGETIYSLNLLPFGGFVRIAGENDLPGKEKEVILTEEQKDLFVSKPIWKRSLVVLAGVFANFVLGWFILSSVFMVGIAPKVVVGGIEPDSPAEAAGFKPGDILLGYAQSKQFVDFVNSKKGAEITLRVSREGKEIDLSATPRRNLAAGKGALGIYLGDGGIEKQGFFGALMSGFKQAISVSEETTLAFWGIIKSIFVYRTLPQDIVGPVGIVSIAAQTGKLGVLYFLQFLAIISLNLAVINLLPFPALDGGKFLMLLLEKAKGSPLPKTAEVWINAAGFLLLILLMATVTVRDVGRL